MARNGDSGREWHLDKRVNISIIIALAFHLGTSVWWAAGMTEKMTQVEQRLEKFSVRNSVTDREVQEQSEEIAILAQRMNSTIESVDLLRTEVAVTNQLLRDLITYSKQGSPR